MGAWANKGTWGLVRTPPHTHLPSSSFTAAPNQDRFFRGNFLSGADRMRDVAEEGHGQGNKWMADSPVDRQLEIRVSHVGLPSAVKLKGLWFPEIRVISQLCLKMCQQPAEMDLTCQFSCPSGHVYSSSSEMQEHVVVFLLFFMLLKYGQPCQNPQYVPHHKNK